jgi:hypothetical protein
MGDNATRWINRCRESLVHRAFEYVILVQYRRQDLPLGSSDMFFVARYCEMQSYFGGVGHVPQECVVARRARPDQRWNAGVGAGDGQPEMMSIKGEC